MSNFITKTFDWKAASERISEQLEEGNSVVQARIEKHIGMLIFRQYRYGKQYDQLNELATTFFDMDGIRMSNFSTMDNQPINITDEFITQEQYMLRLMELYYAIKVVYSDAKAREAFHYYSVGDHDT